MRAFASFALCVAALLAASPAHAYCYSGFCPSDYVECEDEDGSCNAYLCSCVGVGDGCSCEPGFFGDLPSVCFDTPSFDPCKRLRWPERCTGFAVQRDGIESEYPLDAGDLGDVVAQAFAAWTQADCGGGLTPGVYVQDMGSASCNQVEYNDSNDNPGKGNVNVVIARAPGRWPHGPQAGHNIALTTTTFDPTTGELLNADIELNGDYVFSLEPLDQEYDLLSVLTHETGHFLGLGHSQAMDSATMRPSYPEDDRLALRYLGTDDLAAICNLYPPDADIDRSCNVLPRHGFSPDCASSQLEGDCSVGMRAPARPTSFLLLAMGAALLAARRRDAR